MVGDEEGNEKVASPEDASDASRVLNQDEIDSLLGLSEVGDGATDQSGLNTILIRERFASRDIRIWEWVSIGFDG